MPHLKRYREQGVPHGGAPEPRRRILPALALAGTLAGTCPAGLALADQPPSRQTRSLDEIVVIAQRDEAVQKQVERALHEDPYFNDAHVTVAINNGVVTLSGIVFDDWDLRTAKRIARRIPGVRKVIDELELSVGGD